MGEEMLVRGDDGAPVGEGGRDQRPRWLVAAHDLDDHVDVGARDQVGGTVGQQVLGDAGGPRPGHVPDRDAGEDQRRAVGWGQARRPLEQRAHDLAADGARAEHADAQGLEAHGKELVTGQRTTGWYRPALGRAGR